MQLIIIKEWGDLAARDYLAPDQPICLVAHPDFAANYGLRYYLLAQQHLQKPMAEGHVKLGIACHDSPSFALQAIASHVDRLYFIKKSPYWLKIASLCQQSGIVLCDQEELLCLL